MVRNSEPTATTGHTARPSVPAAWAKARSLLRRQVIALSLGALLAVSAFVVPAHAQATTGQWQFTGGLAMGHGNTHLVQLQDGRVLAISGDEGNGVFTSTAEVYDPNTGQWTPAGTLNDARVAFGQPSVLPNGEVLVAGGHDPNVNDYATAELYNPATNQWTLTGSLNTARRYDVQVELNNGQVLVATGASGPPTCARFLTSAELYNPSTGQWTYTGSTQVPRESDTGIRLKDGRVLLAGGYTCGDTDPVTTEIYDPATGQWSLAGNLPHGWMGGTMVLLKDGRVLMVDGWQHATGTNFAEAVIFDPATNQWSPAASPALPRSGADATLLPDGRVLVSQGGQLQSEIYDPATNTWSLDATALDENNGGQTVLLPTGNVLLAGGYNSTGASSTAELYSPALIPQAISFTGPGTGTYGGSATLTATGGGSGNPVVFTVDPSTTSGTCTVSGTSGATVSYTGTGNCVINANQAGGSGYSSAPQAQQSITVSPAPLSITASSSTMTYGSNPPGITPSYAGFVAGDGPGGLTTQPACSTTATNVSPVGSYQSTCSGASDPNYQISYISGVVTVLGNYVAMGDSYSSGEGNPPFVLNGQDTSTPTDKCHRSPESYPALLAADPASLIGSFVDVACSGAVTQDFVEFSHSKYPTEKAQISALKATTNVVTFTIGGNDVGFVSVLYQCVNVPVVNPVGYGCSKNKNLIRELKSRIAALEGTGTVMTPDGTIIIPIQRLLKRIHHKAPLASIFVAGYPHLFGSSTMYFQASNDAPSKYVCPVGLFGTVDYADAQWLNSQADALDAAIAAAVAKAQAAGVPVTYVSAVPGDFSTHGLCDSSSPWIHGLVLGFPVDPGSFHPTPTGQSDGYEVAFSGP